MSGNISPRGDTGSAASELPDRAHQKYGKGSFHLRVFGDSTAYKDEWRLDLGISSCFQYHFWPVECGRGDCGG